MHDALAHYHPRYGANLGRIVAFPRSLSPVARNDVAYPLQQLGVCNLRRSVLVLDALELCLVICFDEIVVGIHWFIVLTQRPKLQEVAG